MTTEQAELIARVKALDAKATKGPIDVWTHETNGEVSFRLRAPLHRNMAWVSRCDDAEAFALYRTAAPALANLCEEKDRRIAELEKELEIERGESAEASRILHEQDKDVSALRSQLAVAVKALEKAKRAFHLARNSAAGLTNYCEESASSRRCERELEEAENLWREADVASALSQLQPKQP